MRERTQYKWGRIAVHLLSALIGAYLILVLRCTAQTMWILGLSIGGTLIALDILRPIVFWPYVKHRLCLYRNGDILVSRFQAFIYAWLEKFVKEVYLPSERRGISSGVWYFGGMLITYGFACIIGKPWIAGYGFIFQGVVDSAARIVGIRWPIVRVEEWKNKTFGGFLGGFFSGLAVAFLFFSYSNLVSLDSSVAAVKVAIGICVGCFCASLTEVYAKKLDNLLIPFVSSFAMWIAIITP